MSPTLFGLCTDVIGNFPFVTDSCIVAIGAMLTSVYLKEIAMKAMQKTSIRLA